MPPVFRYGGIKIRKWKPNPVGSAILKEEFFSYEELASREVTSIHNITAVLSYPKHKSHFLIWTAWINPPLTFQKIEKSTKNGKHLTPVKTHDSVVKGQLQDITIV